MKHQIIFEKINADGSRRIIIQDAPKNPGEWELMLNDTAWGVRRFFSAFFRGMGPALVFGTAIILLYVSFWVWIIDKVLR